MCRSRVISSLGQCRRSCNTAVGPLAPALLLMQKSLLKMKKGKAPREKMLKNLKACTLTHYSHVIKNLHPDYVWLCVCMCAVD